MVIFLAAKLVGGYYPMPTCQEELNLFDNSIAPLGLPKWHLLLKSVELTI